MRWSLWGVGAAATNKHGLVYTGPLLATTSHTLKNLTIQIEKKPGLCYNPMYLTYF